jgi:prophage maintenance system killer protein
LSGPSPEPDAAEAYLLRRRFDDYRAVAPESSASSGLADARRTAAVLVQHLAKNHPLYDANKRAAFLLTAQLLDTNGLAWRPRDVAIDAGTGERVAAGEATHEEVVDWIGKRTREKGDEPPAIS